MLVSEIFAGPFHLAKTVSSSFTVTKTFDRNEELEEEITAKATINELLEDEHTTDVEQLLQWAADMDAHEEDLMELLKYQVKTSFVVYKRSI